MTEEFLHYVWKFRNFDQKALITTSGETLQIENFGQYNHNAGPDFLHGAVLIEGKRWEGNIEIHLRSSDWYAHHHQEDTNYISVVLHVVYEYDKPVYLDNGMELPTLVLSGRINEHLYWNFEQFISQKKRLPCAGQLDRVAPFYLEKELETNLVNRLERKAQVFKHFLKETEENWVDSFFLLLGYGFGLKVNAAAFSELIRKVTPRLLMRHSDDLLILEALLFGVSGLLPSSGGDQYAELLRRQYEFLKAKYQLREMEATNWKFSRMRPSGFPTRKIALLAALLHKHNNLMQQFLDKTLLPPHWEGIHPSDYWKHHYNFGKRTAKNLGGLSADFIRNLQINVQFPFLLYWATENNDDILKTHIIDSLEKLPAENNRITRQYKELGFPNSTAFYSQGILELAQQKCEQKKCLQCGIGTQLLKQK